MEIGTLKSVDMNAMYNVKPVISTSEGIHSNAEPVVQQANQIVTVQNGTENENEKKVDEKDIEEINSALNSFMRSLNTDLRFSYHEKTNRLIVQMIDIKDNKVVKEFPPKDFLDMVARIRDYLGALVDKKV